jgi:hypothetical protein
MANTEATQPKSRRTGPGWLPVVVALVAVGLFLGWLATRQPDETVAVAEPGAGEGVQEEAAVDDVPATVIRTGDLVQQAGEYVGQVVEIPSVAVLSPLGSSLFWIELPGGAPYLVKLADAQIDRGAQVPQTGRNVQVVGEVREKTGAVLDEWMERGVLQTEDHRLQAEYGTTYIEARRVQPAGGE